MPIEIGHLSIKSTVVQRAADHAGLPATMEDESATTYTFDEQARSELLAQCRALVREMLERARER
ncbi:hypothetical protein AB870_22815 [Pandoraea faecigallinarum]|uniref:Uncharacterized protein n=1 Tax=Pandoraea faecigallinarum TaxID=656179 RepID=A0A0H3X039_9BURK|nr:DUF5908 family protein [Pandoraea faecigallinarum]AKM32323.1 hypothetical protein AB870_22815 [Pandoraea faecigallinarum]